jgi:choline kinase
MSDLTLVILAAGLGSRYGSVKQMEGLGPSNEVLLDYSVYDAVRCGFNKVVLVIRKEMETGFCERISRRFENRVDVEFAFQTLDRAPEGREKPLGTGHALLSASEQIQGPFAAINADDFYGPTSFRILSQSLSGISSRSGVLIGFELDKTLSDYGSVSRAVCEASSENILTKIEEHTNISKGAEGITGYFDGILRNLRTDAIVSLNLWGFSDDFMPFLEEQMDSFLKNMQNPLTDEFFLPAAVFNWIQQKAATVELKSSQEKWLGLTNPADRADAVTQLLDRITKGEYPANLWA